MRLHVDGRNVKTIRMYAEAQIVADTGAETVIAIKHPNGPIENIDVPPRLSVVNEALAGIEFLSAIDSVK